MTALNKNLAGVIFFLILTFEVSAQSDIKEYLNDSVKFELVYGRINRNEKNNLSQLFLETILHDTVKSYFFKLKDSQLVSLLNEKQTAWATNLLLYEKYREDPTIFQSTKTIRQWELKTKKIDLNYWNNFLKKKRLNKIEKKY